MLRRGLATTAPLNPLLKDDKQAIRLPIFGVCRYRLVEINRGICDGVDHGPVERGRLQRIGHSPDDRSGRLFLQQVLQPSR